MDKETQQRFRPQVEARLSEIDIQLSEGKQEGQPVSPDNAVGRLSRLDAMQMQQMALAARQRLMVEQVGLREALQRLDRGTFGACLLCGKDIALERLEFQPSATTCIACAARR